MQKKKYIGILLFALVLPLVAFAQAPAGLTRVIDFFFAMLGIVAGILAGVAVLVFFWGLAMYIRKDEKEYTKARQLMVWGTIGIFIIFSVWGLVAFLEGTFGITRITECEAPSLEDFFTSCIL
jgi:FtsH-binding integral membrane protein